MGIFSRTRDIVAANFADLLEKAEDPAKMIRMIILEMEETLVEVRASAARTIADQKEMRRHVNKLDQLQDSWTEKAELALSKNREDLAKAALVERQKAADMAEQLKIEVGVLDDALRASEEDIAKLQKKLSEARCKQSNVQTRLESANNRYRLREMYAGPKTHEAFSRFDQLERRVDDAEGRAEAMGLGAIRMLDDEINELRANDKVDAELAALKARIADREVEMTAVLVCAILFVALPWLVFHYITKWKTAPKITQEDEQLLDEMYNLARRLEDRVMTVERIVAADHPDWKPRLGTPQATYELDRRN